MKILLLQFLFIPIALATSFCTGNAAHIDLNALSLPSEENVLKELENFKNFLNSERFLEKLNGPKINFSQLTLREKTDYLNKRIGNISDLEKKSNEIAESIRHAWPQVNSEYINLDQGTTLGTVGSLRNNLLERGDQNAIGTVGSLNNNLLNIEDQNAMLEEKFKKEFLQKQQEEAEILKTQQAQAALFKKKQEEEEEQVQAELLRKKQEEEQERLRIEEEKAMLLRKKQEEEQERLRREEEEKAMLLIKKHEEEQERLRIEEEKAMLLRKKQEEEQERLRREEEEQERLRREQKKEELFKKKQEALLISNQEKEKREAEEDELFKKKQEEEQERLRREQKKEELFKKKQEEVKAQLRIFIREQEEKELLKRQKEREERAIMEQPDNLRKRKEKEDFFKQELDSFWRNRKDSINKEFSELKVMPFGVKWTFDDIISQYEMYAQNFLRTRTDRWMAINAFKEAVQLARMEDIPINEYTFKDLNRVVPKNIISEFLPDSGEKE